MENFDSEQKFIFKAIVVECDALWYICYYGYQSKMEYNNFEIDSVLFHCSQSCH